MVGSGFGSTVKTVPGVGMGARAGSTGASKNSHNALLHFVNVLQALRMFSQLTTELCPSAFYTAERDEGWDWDHLLCGFPNGEGATALANALAKGHKTGYWHGSSTSTGSITPSMYWPLYVHVVMARCSQLLQEASGTDDALDIALRLGARCLHARALAPIAFRTQRFLKDIEDDVVAANGKRGSILSAQPALLRVLRQHLAVLSGEPENGTVLNAHVSHGTDTGEDVLRSTQFEAHAMMGHVQWFAGSPEMLLPVPQDALAVVMASIREDAGEAIERQVATAMLVASAKTRDKFHGIVPISAEDLRCADLVSVAASLQSFDDSPFSDAIAVDGRRNDIKKAPSRILTGGRACSACLSTS
jgi:hypothetical protein